MFLTFPAHAQPAYFILPATKLGYWIHPVCPSVRPSVRLSVCPLTFRIRPVASPVQDGFFPYLVQMINSMRGCVACDDPWPWPISSRSFGLDLENRVRSVTFSVLDRLFPYLPQIVTNFTTIRGCVACKVYNKIMKFQFFANFSNFLVFTLKKNLQFCLHSIHIWHKSLLASEDVSYVMTFDLDLYFHFDLGSDMTQ